MAGVSRCLKKNTAPLRTLRHSLLISAMATCQQCQQTFARTSSLTRHLREKHGQNQSRIECGECARTFSRAEHYRRHVRTQHNQAFTLPSYPCPACPNKIFNRLDHLRQHLQSCPALKMHKVALVELKQSEPTKQTEPLKVTINVKGAERMDQAHLFLNLSKTF